MNRPALKQLIEGILAGRIKRESLTKGMKGKQAQEVALVKTPEDKMLYVDQEEAKVIRLIFDPEIVQVFQSKFVVL